MNGPNPGIRERTPDERLAGAAADLQAAARMEIQVPKLIALAARTVGLAQAAKGLWRGPDADRFISIVGDQATRLKEASDALKGYVADLRASAARDIEYANQEKAFRARSAASGR
jgi:hypothetical protein